MKLTTKPKTAKFKKIPSGTQAAAGPNQQTAGQPAVAQASATLTGGVNRQLAAENIAARAYRLWEKAGRPQGRDLEHWFLAESQLQQSFQAVSA